MIDTKKIIEAAERKLQGTDMFVVGCTCTPGNEIELLIDSDTSVAIEACAELSRAVEAEFDRDEEDFSLTVASAGIGSELKSLRQYRKLIGGTVEVLLNSGIKMLAKLDAADDEGITISYEEKPVSYTHLDVYKRQAVIRSWRATAAAAGANTFRHLSLIHI